MQENLARFQEISNRGLQDKLPPEIRSRFDEVVRRGLLQQAEAQDVSTSVSGVDAVSGVQPVELRPEQAATPIEQDFIPTEEALAVPAPGLQQPTIGEQALGTLETTGAIVSSAIAEPAAGLAGAVTAPFVGVDEAVKNIDSIRDLLTFNPRSEESKSQLQAIGKALKPVGEAVSTAESFLGNSVLEATGSPELAAAAHSLPTAILELIGVKALKSTKLKDARLSSNIAEAIQQSAPDIKTINTAKNNAYAALDDFGVKVKSQTFDDFANRINARLTKEGVDPTLTPKSTAALKRIIDAKGSNKSLSELDTLRRIAKGAANDIDKTDARLGNIIISELDSSIDKLSNQIGGKFKEARGLAQRAFKSQDITDMIENASHTASGLENGLRIEARKILKNKKRRKGFTNEELSALRKIEQGTTTANIAKFLGKFGISEGQATSMLGASIGIGGGGAIGSAFGGTLGAGVGALAVPALGQIAKKTAQRITLKNTKLADDLIRAGKNSKEIAKAYLKNTPISERNVSDLTDLLLDPNIRGGDVKSLIKTGTTSSKLISDALFFVNEIKRRSTQVAATAAITQPELDKENK